MKCECTFDQASMVSGKIIRCPHCIRRDELLGKLVEFRGRIKELADNAYVDGCRRTEKTECLGYEAKMKFGSFGKAELQAHKESAQAFGQHQGLLQAAIELDALLAEAKEAQDEAP